MLAHRNNSCHRRNNFGSSSW